MKYYYTVMGSPVGDITLISDAHSLCAIYWPNQKPDSEKFPELEKKAPFVFRTWPRPSLACIKKETKLDLKTQPGFVAYLAWPGTSLTKSDTVCVSRGKGS